MSIRKALFSRELFTSSSLNSTSHVVDDFEDANCKIKNSDIITTMRFNQDYRTLAVGSTTQFTLYNLNPFGKFLTYPTNSPVYCLELLFSTSLLALVTRSPESPRKLKIINTKRQSIICELTFPNTVLGILMNRKRLVVILESQCYIYDISNMKRLYTIHTRINPLGVAALSPNSNTSTSYLAYPHGNGKSDINDIQRTTANTALNSNINNANTTTTNVSENTNHTHQSNDNDSQEATKGNVCICDTIQSPSGQLIIKAHRSQLACMEFNSDGSLLATASITGTVIKVFSVPQCQRLFSFRRGSIPVQIQTLAFHHNNTYMAVASTGDTVHIYKLKDSRKLSSEDIPPRNDTEICDKDDVNRSCGSENLNAKNYSEKEVATSSIASPSLFSGPPQRQISPSTNTLKKRFASFSSKITDTVLGYVSSNVGQYWEPERDFAQIKLSEAKHTHQSPSGASPIKKIIVGFSPQESDTLMVADTHGNFQIYKLDEENGGQCQRIEEYQVIN